jgi:signal transduction histidine kinase
MKPHAPGPQGGGPDRGSDRGLDARRYPQPFQICAGPAALPIVQALAARGWLNDARILSFDGDRPPEFFGPAILVLCPADLRGPRRGVLLDLMHAALPGRPVLYGGTGNRDVLLDAINNWRVSRIVPDEPRPELLLDGIRKAHAALELECGVEQAAAELRAETQSLEHALHVLRETEERTRKAERLATLGRITSSLIPVIGAHLDALQDFNTLLVAGSIEPDPKLDELLTYAFTGIRSLHAMLDEIRSYAESRPEVYRLELEEADGVVHFVVSFCRYDPLAGRRRLTAQLGSRAKIRADSFRLYQSLINLLRNAFQATPPGGEVVVRTSATDDDVIIDVENTGDPIPPDVQARLFEPFFSTKGEGGMGLGLSTCRITIERHAGTITCTSEVGQPTQFRIRLPRA